MKKKIFSVLAVLTMMASASMVTMAAENSPATKTDLQSRGIISYSDGGGSVVIDASDFYTLADRLDLFKVRAVKQLGTMRTYLTRSGGGVAMSSADGVHVVHHEDQVGEAADPLSLSFATILEGIAISQSIPAEPAAYGLPDGTKLYKKANGELSMDDADGAEPISIQAAAPGNLSAGTAAWVNGELMLGTGADTAQLVDEASGMPEVEETATKHSISSGYTLTEAVPVAYAYVVTTGHSSDGEDGNNSAPNPTCTASSCKKVSQIFGGNYFRNGYNVKTAVYRIVGLSEGAVVRGSGGQLFY